MLSQHQPTPSYSPNPLLVVLQGLGRTIAVVLLLSYLPLATATEPMPEPQPQVPVPTDVPAPPIVLGQPRNAPYVVAIPTSDLATLLLVQNYVPAAFITDSSKGQYIQAGAFSDRARAEERSRGLRNLGFDARVAYFPVP